MEVLLVLAILVILGSLVAMNFGNVLGDVGPQGGPQPDRPVRAGA